jgi:hypothetical protein
VYLFQPWLYRGVLVQPYFCGRDEAGDYQSIHLSLTGLRAIFVPLAGIFIYDIAGFSFTFSLAMLFPYCWYNSDDVVGKAI